MLIRHLIMHVTRAVQAQEQRRAASARRASASKPHPPAPPLPQPLPLQQESSGSLPPNAGAPVSAPERLPVARSPQASTAYPAPSPPASLTLRPPSAASQPAAAIQHPTSGGSARQLSPHVLSSAGQAAPPHNPAVTAIPNPALPAPPGLPTRLAGAGAAPDTGACQDTAIPQAWLPAALPAVVVGDGSQWTAGAAGGQAGAQPPPPLAGDQGSANGAHPALAHSAPVGASEEGGVPMKGAGDHQRSPRAASGGAAAGPVPAAAAHNCYGSSPQGMAAGPAHSDAPPPAPPAKGWSGDGGGSGGSGGGGSAPTAASAWSRKSSPDLQTSQLRPSGFQVGRGGWGSCWSGSAGSLQPGCLAEW